MFFASGDNPGPRRPPTSAVLTVNAAGVVLVCLYLTAQAVAELSAPRNPFTLMDAMCFTPGYLALGAAQAVAVLRRSAGAATLTTVLAALLGLGLFVNCVDMRILSASSGLDGASTLALRALAAGYAVFIAVLNRRWAALLKRPLPAGYCVYCGYDLRASPGRCPECGRPG